MRLLSRCGTLRDYDLGECWTEAFSCALDDFCGAACLRTGALFISGITSELVPTRRPDGTEEALTTKQRKALPKSDFAIPATKQYPIEDASHARNALARVAQNGTPAQQATVKAAVKEVSVHRRRWQEGQVALTVLILLQLVLGDLKVELVRLESGLVLTFLRLVLPLVSACWLVRAGPSCGSHGSPALRRLLFRHRGCVEGDLRLIGRNPRRRLVHKCLHTVHGLLILSQ